MKTIHLNEILTNYRRKAVRNTYSLQVFECISSLTGYTAELLVALSDYDCKRDFVSRNNLLLCVRKFDAIRENMEHVYSQIRILNQPEGYQLPMNHHAHLAIQSVDSDWMFWYEIEFLQQLTKYLKHVDDGD